MSVWSFFISTIFLTFWPPCQLQVLMALHRQKALGQGRILTTPTASFFTFRTRLLPLLLPSQRCSATLLTHLPAYPGLCPPQHYLHFLPCSFPPSTYHALTPHQYKCVTVALCCHLPRFTDDCILFPLSSLYLSLTMDDSHSFQVSN